MNSRALLIIIGTVHTILAIIGVISYPGTKLIFLAFAIAFAFLMYSTYLRRRSAFIFFLGTMLWLGFFGKIVWHLFIGHPFTDPTGAFKGSAEQWDQVLVISSIGAAAFFTSIVLFKKSDKNADDLFRPRSSWLSFYFKKNSALIFFIFLICLFLLAIYNFNAGIYLIGIKPMTLLPWPLNAIICWALYMGFSLVLCFLTQEEFLFRGNVNNSFWIILFGSLLTAVAIISRGQFFYHATPILYIMYIHRKVLMLTKVKLALKTIAFLAVFTTSLATVTLLRSYFYDENTMKQFNGFSLEGAFFKFFHMDEKTALVISQTGGLVINRWVGAEGLMTVVSFPDKGIDFFKDFIFDNFAESNSAIYNKISNSVYKPNDRYYFSSVPGIFAALFFSGQYWIVFAGTLLLCLGCQFVEKILSNCFSNHFLTSFLGLHLANIVAQFGLGMRSLSISLLITGSFLAFIFFISKYMDAHLNAKIRN